MLVGLRTLHDKYLPDLSERSIYEMARNGDIPSLRVGTRWLFDPEEVIRTLKERQPPKVTQR